MCAHTLLYYQTISLETTSDDQSPFVAGKVVRGRRLDKPITALQERQPFREIPGVTDRPLVVQMPETKVDSRAKINRKNSAISSFENTIFARERTKTKPVVAAAFERRSPAAVDSEDSDDDSDFDDDAENVSAGGSDMWKNMASQYL